MSAWSRAQQTRVVAEKIAFHTSQRRSQAARPELGWHPVSPVTTGLFDCGMALGEAIAESVNRFAKQTGAHVGVVGLSFLGGLALVAASEPQYRSAFKFILAVHSQHSMGRVTEYYRTGRDARPNGSFEELSPHEYGPLVLEYHSLGQARELERSCLPAAR